MIVRTSHGSWVADFYDSATPATACCTALAVGGRCGACGLEVAPVYSRVARDWATMRAILEELPARPAHTEQELDDCATHLVWQLLKED